MPHSPDAEPRTTDVAVIGGGPGGSTIATLLARKGWRVELFEKEAFPRFHIGESLLPRNLPLLERLGVLEETRRIGIPKHGAEFIPQIAEHQRHTFYFARSLKPGAGYAFEVPRARFDRVLLDNATRHGVAVHQPARVRQVDLGSGAQAHRLAVEEADGSAGEVACRFVVDASGRDTLLSRSLEWKRKHPHHDMAAIYAHCRGAVRREGLDEGNISIYWFEHGWIWLIPLPDGVMSVGAVCRPAYLKGRDKPLAEFFWDTVRQCPGAWERLRDAELDGEVSGTGNYSYRSRRAYGNRFLLVGDAYTFLDPVFSSGVLLAMSGAEMGADAVDRALRRPALARYHLWRHQARLDRTIARIAWFIYRFNSPAMQRLFSTATDADPARKNFLGIEAAVTSLLGGDFFDPRGIRLPLTLFKGIYYATAWRHRQA
ncbi:MAG TPA: NAD(P)/FAD-dependent oxidoreductase [Gammaproteobacteria bacterium]|nr:NAD(P)/FAD-dependent oxidoreductase [Gammaproteobacteria bacterium]